MPSPNSTTYQRPDIDEAMVEFDLAAATEGFVGLQLAPPFNTPEQSGNFPKVPIEAILEEAETKRNNKGGYHQSDWEFGQESFETSEHGAVERIDERQRKIYAYALDFDVICAHRARYKVLNRLEREIRDAVQVAGATTAVATKWDQSHTSDPVADVLNEQDTFKAGCGLLPNVGWCTDKVLRKLAQNGAIKDQVKFSGLDDPKLLTEPGRRAAFVRALADLLALEELVIASAVRNSAAKGQAFAGAQLWDDTQFGLIRVPKSRDLTEIGALRTFVWDGDGAGIGGAFETYWSDEYRSEMMRFRHERQVKTLRAVCVRRLTGVL